MSDAQQRKFECNQQVEIACDLYTRVGLQRMIAGKGDIVTIVKISPKMQMPYAVDDGSERYWVAESEITVVPPGRVPPPN